MRRVVFYRNKGVGYQPQKEVVEFDEGATDEEVGEAYEEWVWEEVADEFTWYDEGEDEE